MLHDKTLFFFNKTALAKTAGTSITSKLIDLRLNGDDIDGRVFIYAVLAKAPSAGSVTFKLLTSDDGSNWTEALVEGNVGEVLYKGRLPLGLKRYLKATATVDEGTGAEGADVDLDAATTVFAELTDTIDHEGPVKVQQWNGIPQGGSVPEGMEDLAKAGDTVRATVES